MRLNPSLSRPGKAPAGILNDDFLVDLDIAFDKIQVPEPRSSRNAAKRQSLRTTEDLYGMQTTFIELTQMHLRPVLRYLKAIQQGVASRLLCEIVHYVVGPLVGKTRAVGLRDQTHALIDFQRTLKKTLRSTGTRIPEDGQLELAESFLPVAAGFELEMRGHSTAVVNLLGFYKSLKKSKEIDRKDLERLFAIGIPSLTMLRKSSIEEIVSLSGIEPSKVSTVRRAARSFNILSLV